MPRVDRLTRCSKHVDVVTLGILARHFHSRRAKRHSTDGETGRAPGLCGPKSLHIGNRHMALAYTPVYDGGMARLGAGRVPVLGGKKSLHIGNRNMALEYHPVYDGGMGRLEAGRNAVPFLERRPFAIINGLDWVPKSSLYLRSPFFAAPTAWVPVHDCLGG